MKNLYRNLSLYLVDNQAICKDDQKLYEYAIKVFIQGNINIFVTILIGYILGMTKECIYFLIAFFILRKFTGGLHANKYINCLTSSIIILTLSLFTIQHLEKNTYQVLFNIILTIATILICLFSPNDNINKKLTHKEKQIYKFVSIILSLLIWFICLFFLSKNTVISYSLGISLIINALLLILSYTKDFLKYCKKKK